MNNQQDTISQFLDLLIEACHQISQHIRHCDPSDMAKLVGNDNLSGDHIKLLDQLSQKYLFDTLSSHPEIYGIISEEHPDVYKTNNNGNYIIAFDPLDGSSNIEFNITTGTIFGVYKLNNDKQIDSGRNIVLAGYCLYGGITEFVHTTPEQKVKMIRLSEHQNKPYLINNDIKMPDKGGYYSVNQSYMNKWLNPYLKDCIFDLCQNNYSLRYVGSMVADAHRVIMKGGVFMYPGDTNNKGGKIRLLYEAYPFAYLLECVGGLCTNFEIPILDVKVPDNIHEPTPILLGSHVEVNEIMKKITQ